MGLGVKHIHIPATDEEFKKINELKGREQSWRDYALPLLLGTEQKKKKK